MTEKELKQYRGLIVEIEQLQRQIDRLNNTTVSDTVTSAAEFPYSMHSVKITGVSVSTMNQIQRIQTQIQIRQLNAAQLLAQIEDFIQSVDDTYMRGMIHMRYVDGRSWQSIAMRYGYADESTPRRLVNKFIKN